MCIGACIINKWTMHLIIDELPSTTGSPLIYFAINPMFHEKALLENVLTRTKNAHILFIFLL